VQRVVHARRVIDLFRQTRTEKIFHFYPTAQAAVRSLSR